MSRPEPRRLEASVHGRVQGVGFRWFVVRTASDLGLLGWVANEPDGSVSLVAEGPDDRLEELLAALRLGPPSSSVREVRSRFSPATGRLGGFLIRSSGHTGD